MTKVEQYARFECERQRKSRTGYPYQETELIATVTDPSGREIAFWGFYDGNDTWRIRYIPNQLGVWRVHLCFADGSDAWDEEFECVPSDILGEHTIKLDLSDEYEQYQLIRIDTLSDQPDTVEIIPAGAVNINVSSGEEVLLSIFPLQ